MSITWPSSPAASGKRRFSLTSAICWALAATAAVRRAGTAQRVSLYYGVRTADLAAGVEDFRAAGATVHLASDDGSLGFPGFVTQLLAAARAAATPRRLRSRTDAARPGEPGPALGRALSSVAGNADGLRRRHLLQLRDTRPHATTAGTIGASAWMDRYSMRRAWRGISHEDQVVFGLMSHASNKRSTQVCRLRLQRRLR